MPHEYSDGFNHRLGSACPSMFHLWLFIKSSNWDQIDAVVHWLDSKQVKCQELTGKNDTFTSDSSYHAHLCPDLIMFPEGSDVHVTLVIVTDKRDLQRELSRSHSQDLYLLIFILSAFCSSSYYDFLLTDSEGRCDCLPIMGLCLINHVDPLCFTSKADVLGLINGSQSPLKKRLVTDLGRLNV